MKINPCELLWWTWNCRWMRKMGRLESSRRWWEAKPLEKLKMIQLRLGKRGLWWAIWRWKSCKDWTTRRWLRAMFSCISRYYREHCSMTLRTSLSRLHWRLVMIKVVKWAKQRSFRTRLAASLEALTMICLRRLSRSCKVVKHRKTETRQKKDSKRSIKSSTKFLASCSLQRPPTMTLNHLNQSSRKRPSQGTPKTHKAPTWDCLSQELRKLPQFSQTRHASATFLRQTISQKQNHQNRRKIRKNQIKRDLYQDSHRISQRLR